MSLGIDEVTRVFKSEIKILLVLGFNVTNASMGRFSGVMSGSRAI